ncbi:MAG: Na+/H+ antiporter subunit E [Solirubrobacteraceae bacterium]|nr:Na+/H+ antiporter subunit E [Solirubrobacteraceae bacterium]
MRRFVSTVVLLAAVYLLTLSSHDWVDLLFGLAFGTIVAAALRGRIAAAPGGARPPIARRVAGFPVFAGAVIFDVLAGTLDVALRVLGIRRLECPGIVRVPIGERSERGIAISALATTLSPGTVFVDVDGDDMLLHVIDASDPDAVRAKLQQFYDRYQRSVFP